MLVLFAFCFLSFICSGQAKMSCALVRCARPTCTSGVLQIKDLSGCCKICEKRKEGESCGGLTNGVCDDDLFCKTSSDSKYGICESNKPDCKSTSDAGPCEAHIKKWFFNYKTKMCQQFVYGGCRGNKNRYDSKMSCEKSCAK